jgi:hypothetical protein
MMLKDGVVGICKMVIGRVMRTRKTQEGDFRRIVLRPAIDMMLREGLIPYIHCYMKDGVITLTLTLTLIDWVMPCIHRYMKDGVVDICKMVIGRVMMFTYKKIMEEEEPLMSMIYIQGNMEIEGRVMMFT